MATNGMFVSFTAAWLLFVSHGSSIRPDVFEKINFESVRVDVDLDRVIHRVNERFLSVAIDASLVAEEKFMYLLASPKLKTLSSALSPGFLRFGGTKQDFMEFNPYSYHGRPKNSFPHLGDMCKKLQLPPALEENLKKEWSFQALLLQQEERKRKYRKVRFTEYAVDLLYSFANCTGLDLIFGLNALLRTSGNSWNSQNAKMLLDYCESMQYNMSWELGNEPNSYQKKAGVRVEGSQLGQDFVHLRRILSESKLYQSSGLYGPDISQPREHRRDLLEGFLENGAEAINACTWHHYYVNGRDTSLEDFLDPNVLDTLATKIYEVHKTVDAVSPGKKVWLGETSSAYGGGAIGLSDTFAAGFMWLDKLGLSAKLGLDVIIRQVLIGSGTYHLVDDNLDPLPDYWLSVLYKRLVGPEVLNVSVLSTLKSRKHFRLYGHCTNRRSASYKKGAVTLFALNLGKGTAEISLPAHLANSTMETFVLEGPEAEQQGLLSRSVKLNGVVLKMVDDRTLPDLRGVSHHAGDPLRLPRFSFAFYVLPEARAPAC